MNGIEKNLFFANLSTLKQEIDQRGSTKEDSRSHNNIRILVIDKKPAFLNRAKRYLELEYGMEVLPARNVEEAHTILEKEKIDAIITEIPSRQTGEWAILNELIKKGDRIPVIVFTNRKKTEIKAEKFEFEPDLILQKGRHPETQYATISSFIRKTVNHSRDLALLEKYRENFILFFEDIEELVFMCRPDGTCTYANESFLKYFDLKREEILGKIFHPEIHPEDKRRARDHLNSIRPETPQIYLEIRIISRDGTTRRLNLKIRAIFGSNGEVIEYLSIGRKINETENTLIFDRKISMYKDLPHLLDEAVFALDAQGRVIFWNRRMEDLTDIPSSEIVGKGNRAHANSIRAMTGPMLIDLLLSSEGEPSRFSASIERDGRTYVLARPVRIGNTWYEIIERVIPFFDDRGELTGAVEVIRTSIGDGRWSGQKEPYPDGGVTILIAKNDRILSMNPSGYALFGIDEHSAEGVTLGKFIHMDDRSSISDDGRRMKDECLPRTCVLRNIERDGKPGIMESMQLSIAAIGEDATLDLIFLFANQYTPHGRALGDLYRILRETAIIYLLDEKGNILYSNSKGAEALELRQDNISNRNVAVHLSERSAEHLLSAIERAIYTGCIERGVSTDGTLADSPWTDFWLAPVRDPYRDERRVLFIASGVKHQKRIIERLKTSHRFMSSIFQGIIDGICVVDRDFRILLANNACVKWFGSESDTHLIGKTCGELLKRCNISCETCPIQNTLITGQTANAIIAVNDESGNPAKWLDIHSSPFVDEETGNRTGAIVYMRDVTKEKIFEQMERKSLEQIEKNIIQLSILNDHIRNPLAVIVALAAMEGGPTMDKILVQAREIDRIITELDMGWLESEKIREFLRKHFGVIHGNAPTQD